MKVWHRETKDRLVIGIDKKEVHLYDRSAEEIGQAVFQAYQAGVWDALQSTGFREDIIEEIFNEAFGIVDFDFKIPVDKRVEELEDWALMYSDESDVNKS